ncbi:MAG: hypothetical protein Q9171_006850 [Xanthocarpia ochracea]
MGSSPDTSRPDSTYKKSYGDKARAVVRACTTKDGLIGDYDYAFLFTPNLPFMRKSRRAAPFFGLNDHMPVLLALVLGFQHALSMLAGIITPPLIIGGQQGVNLAPEDAQYLVSTSLIVCGLLSAVQITRVHIWGPYYIGTGLISVVGTSFTVIPVATGAFAQMYATGYCPTGPDGTKLPCPKGYGALIGTGTVCALLEVGLSFTRPKLLKRVFPPLVTGPTVALIGVKLTESGFQNWAGGSGACRERPESGLFSVCPRVGAPHALPWGSAEFIGLGFSVFVTIILCERFGSPIMKSCAVVLGLLVGCIIAGATGYFSDSGIRAAPAASFIWVKTFPLSVQGSLVLPLLAVYIVLMMEAIGDITATCDVSRLEVEGKLYDSRIQGGVLADGFNSMLSGLLTSTPLSTFAQNNGVIALTRCANRKAGYAACFFLVIMGIFSKFAAAIIAIPSAVLGGMTTFLFAAVAVSGIRIISTVPFTRRNRFILTAALALGFGATLVPEWFAYVFTYEGDNRAKEGFFNAITLICETGFVLAGFVAMFLNLVLQEEVEDEVVDEIQEGVVAAKTADRQDDEMDREEWARIEKGRADGDLERGGEIDKKV